MTARRAIVHIGTEKTGSTAIQATLARNRAHLAGRGFCYSSVAGAGSHVKLTAYAADDDVRDDIRRRLGIATPADLAQFRERLATDLRAEITASPDSVFVFSDEHFQSRLVSQQSVDRLAGLLTPLFDEIRIVVYLRRQDELAVSRHSTALKSGGVPGALIDLAWAGTPFYDYRKLIGRWTEAFGAAALTVRRFETDRLIGGSVVSDFLATTALPELAESKERANESLRPDYQAFLGEMNARLPRFVAGKANPERGDFDRLLADMGRGKGARPARDDARAFYAAFADSNEYIRARYFPGDAALFDDDFSRYPDVADDRGLDVGTALDITASLWRRVIGDRVRMLDDLAALRARAERAEAAARNPPEPLPIAEPGTPRLFQYWNTRERPPVVDALMQGWAKDPAFAYSAATHDAAVAMIRERFDARTLAAFERARVPAMQADLYRLCALHAFGGIYIDADIENIGDNGFLLHRQGRGFLFHRRGNLANDIMVVHEPGDPAIAFALDRALDNIESGAGANVWAMTGPGILTAEYNRRGPYDPLFAGFRFGDVVDVRQHVRFHWNLDYKSTEADWRSAAANALIAPSTDD